jgi:hypothetical protein
MVMKQLVERGGFTDYEKNKKLVLAGNGLAQCLEVLRGNQS